MLAVAKANDCINYEILLANFENAGIRGESFYRFKSYLKDELKK